MLDKLLLRTGRSESGAALHPALPLALVAGLAILPALAFAPELGDVLRAFLVKAMGRIGDNIVTFVGWPVDYTEKFFLPYLLLSFATAAWVLSRETGSGPQQSLLRRIFPPEIYRHRSALNDYGIVLINRIFTPYVLLTRLLSSAALAAWITAALAAHFGPRAPLLEGMPALVAFTLLFGVATDFGDWLQHFLHHRIPLLWEFHKLHHSAEVLTPVTALRNHPVEQVVGSVVETSVIGTATGLAGYWLMSEPHPITFFGAQLFMVFFYCCCAVHLRHTHVWLSWSPGLSRILISPAQHQIHHSSATRHWNRNYGNLLAIWDWMFGSLYVPHGREEFAYGVPEGQPHPTVLKAYLEPFLGATRLLFGRFRSGAAAMGRED